MLNTKDTLVTLLQDLSLSRDEAKVYLELLKEPSTHLRLSHVTGINRTKIYRLAEQLEKRSLIARRTDDRGMFLVAADPSTLEVELVSQEERLKERRASLRQLIPTLTALQTSDPSSFLVRTYEGQAGLKQMCWHELKTKGTLVGLGYGTIETTVNDQLWAKRHRARQISAGYSVQELINKESASLILADKQLVDAHLYNARIISSDVLHFDNQTIIYNDTVAIYHWKHEQMVGVEIISQTYANMFRQLFDYYWKIANPIPGLSQ